MTGSSEALPADDAVPALQRRHIFAATLGNALEFYDFITYAFFAVQIGRTFFPAGDAYASLMLSLATFGAGFATRPLGAWVIGAYADRVGRTPAMVLSYTLMGGAIIALALTPSYAQIGVAAPLLAVLSRLVQGFSLGGEVGSNTAYLLEAAPRHKRGLIISWQSASQGIAATVGAMVGLILTLVMSAGELEAYGWRIALLIGGVTVPFGLWIRRSMPETLHRAEPAPSLAGASTNTIRLALLGVAIIGSGTIGNYIFQYMATYGQTALHLSAGISLAAETANNAAGVVAALIGGWLSDRYGRRPMMIWPTLLFLLLIYPTFYLFTVYPSATSLIGGNLVLAFTTGLVWGPFYAALSESLPKAQRSRTFALIYALSVATFGGTTQLIVTWLIHTTGSTLAPAWYLIGATLIGLLAMRAMPESAPVVLERRGDAPPLIPGPGLKSVPVTWNEPVP